MLRPVTYMFLIFNVLLQTVRCTHVFNMDRDFSKIKTDQSLADSVGEVVRRLQTFKVAVHPRIRLLYALLRRAVARHAQRHAASLYVPQVYRATNSKET
ncbi:uncharacterized protein LOC106711760 [Papilio machaon]|nr:uncharacterized protein LOC106711760 [Papilio machaon]